MKFAFGPVPSRRLGQSLGISPIPAKTCTLSCIYCQLGSTDKLSIERKSFFPKEVIWDDIKQYRNQSGIDFITFVGDGEPTLNKDIGWLIDKCRKFFDKPVAVITNGTLLYDMEVRAGLLNADVILPSLDAGSEDVFKKINRPHGHLDFDTIIGGLVDLRMEYTGQIWLEVMLIKDINDSDTALNDLKLTIDRIGPDRIYLLTPTRPPSELWAAPPGRDRMENAHEIIENAISVFVREKDDFDISLYDNAHDAILEIGSRHPLRIEQAEKIASQFGESGIVQKMIDEKDLFKISHDKTNYILPQLFRR
ncbi:radical SAM protein [candidate division KSB1 bacterium]